MGHELPRLKLDSWSFFRVSIRLWSECIMNILHVTCSPRGALSESTRLSRRIVDLLRELDPAAVVMERPLGDVPIPHIDANYAIAQHDPARATSSGGSTACSETLIRELESADAVVIGTPMHNLAAPSVLKAWIDHVVRAGRTFAMTPEGKTGTLPDRPVFVAVASGGVFSGERARQPDFLTPWLRHVLGGIGLTDVSVFSIEGTAHDAESVAQAREANDGKLRAHVDRLSLQR